MNYQVLARKWRPANFTEVVGQEHVVKSLMSALRHDRLHHAYLFTGTRGVGKTTLARILAKAINCDNLQEANPCGLCRSCRELDEGRFLDLIEVDAASRTKVEDTRDLLENVQYAPSYGRYKTYLIDEVHMLSGHSFNALLKTLEEPPPHVKFLLATTDPQKIPVTVLSRCLQLNLKRLSPMQINIQMEAILKQEGIAYETQAIQQLARAADGSMRDGLSLLDQAIVHGGGQVSAESVNAMLGTVALHAIETVLIALADDDANAILNRIAEIANIQADFTPVLQQLLQTIHRLALTQIVPDFISEEFDGETIKTLAKRFTPEDLQLFYQIALLGQKDLAIVPDSRMGFEMILLRMLTFRPEAAAQTKSSEKISTIPKPLSQPDWVIQDKQEQSTLHISSNNSSDQSVKAKAGEDWLEMIATMKLEGLTRELANNCLLEQIDDNSCVLVLDASRQQLLTTNSELKLLKALQHYRGKPIKLDVKIAQPQADTPAMQSAKALEDRQQAAIDAINSDANVNALKEHFDAKIIPGSIQPN